MSDNVATPEPLVGVLLAGGLARRMGVATSRLRNWVENRYWIM